MLKHKTIAILPLLCFAPAFGSPTVIGEISFIYDIDTRATSIFVSDQSSMIVSGNSVEVPGDESGLSSNMNFYWEFEEQVLFQISRQENWIYFNPFQGTCQMVYPHFCSDWDGTIDGAGYNPNNSVVLNTFILNGGIDRVSYHVSTVPEPSTLSLIGMGFLFIAGSCFRRLQINSGVRLQRISGNPPAPLPNMSWPHALAWLFVMLGLTVASWFVRPVRWIIGVSRSRRSSHLLQ